MTEAPSTSGATASRTASAPGGSLRRWGALILVLFLLTSAVGGSLAMESSYLLVTLASHIGLAVVTMALAGYATGVVGRSYRPLPRALSALAALCALGATIAGTVFLVHGEQSAPLMAMEGLALAGIVLSVLLIAFGGDSGKQPSGAPTS